MDVIKLLLLILCYFLFVINLILSLDFFWHLNPILGFLDIIFWIALYKVYEEWSGQIEISNND